MVVLSKPLTTNRIVTNTFIGAIRTLVISYGFKGAIALVLGLLFKRKKGIKKIINNAFGQDTLQFAIFLASFSGTYRLLFYVIRSLRGNKNDFLNSFIAAGIAGLCSGLDTKSRRTELGLYVFARAGESLFNSLVDKKLIISVPFGEVFLFNLFCGFIMYSFVYEPSNLPPSYVKWLIGMADDAYDVLLNWKNKVLLPSGRPVDVEGVDFDSLNPNKQKKDIENQLNKK